MISELRLVKKKEAHRQIPMFYPIELSGGEIVLCIHKTFGFVKVFYHGELLTVPEEYLAVWK
jgi:hypothetical protein|tara:strand:+ start:1845 stop:2030 length:186 start_codon:yes stop_codon:yes gene_type:complete